jgi:Domain of unknown function (DUF3883)
MNLEEDEQFIEFLKSKAREGKAAVGYPATLFLQMLNGGGGFKTVNRLLASPRVSEGYTELVVRKRPDLTVEALVTETRWRRFFDPKLLEVAETRLRRTNYKFKRFEEPVSIQPLTPVALVGLAERHLPLASPDAIAAAEWLKVAYGAVLTWESRKEGKQQGDTPVRIYTLPNGAQAAIRMNKNSPALYVRATSARGEDMRDAIAAITQISDVFTGREQNEAPSSILSHAPYLKPAPTNILLRLNPAPGHYQRIFELVLGPLDEPRPGDASDLEGVGASRRPIDEEEFRRRQERNSETGRAGEMVALAWERARLGNLIPPCTDPEKYSRRISPDDVAAGYDILSNWPGEERFIEVKATACSAPEFFMSENERRTLETFGLRAWIYRVELGAAAPVVTPFQDPATHFQGCMSPSAWRVKLP